MRQLRESTRRASLNGLKTKPTITKSRPSRAAASMATKSIASELRDQTPETGHSDIEWEIDFIFGIKLEEGQIQYLVKREHQRRQVGRWEDEENVNTPLKNQFDEVLAHLKSMASVKSGDSSKDKNRGRSGNDEWEVESIWGIRLNTNRNEIQYLVKWQGWAEKYNTWQDYTDCANCPKHTAIYHRAFEAVELVQGQLKGQAGLKTSQVNGKEADGDRRHSDHNKAPNGHRPGPKSRTRHIP